MSGAGIGTRLESAYAELTPQEARAADFMLDNLPDLALYSATELAVSSGVSKATVSRLFRRLGFENSQEVRDHVRGLRSSGTPVVGEADADVAAHEAINLARVLDQPALDDVAELLARAGRVLVVGYRNSFPVALHLREQLAQVRAEVRTGPQAGQSLGEDLADLGPGDAIVIVGFRRRPEHFGRLMRVAGETGAAVVLIADPSARRHAIHAGHAIECGLDTGLPFDSYAAAMSLVSVLAARVLELAGRAGRARVDRISGLYEQLDELEAL